MDTTWKDKLTPMTARLRPLVEKYRIPLLIGLLGLILVLLPGKKQERASPETAEPASLDWMTLQETELRMAQLLSSLEGAGRTEVMLSLASGSETVYQTDKSVHGDETELTTVFSQPAGGEKTPVAAAVRYPVYLGAVILCEGADSAAVRLAVTEAVSSLTGLGSDKITVIKMKSQ